MRSTFNGESEIAAPEDISNMIRHDTIQQFTNINMLMNIKYSD